MHIPLYQVDAFAERPFAGNPAAVCPLDAWLPDTLLQDIALENNLSETAFFVPEDGGYRLRWFTPVHEVDLCGHGTLATAHVLFHELGVAEGPLRFLTRSGELRVECLEDGRLELDFPTLTPRSIEPPPALLAGLGARPLEVHRADEWVNGGNYMAVFGDQAAVAALAPDQNALAELEGFGVIATAPGDSVDFVSRYFAACTGIPEDPVTGSAHCTLTPYWAARLGRDLLEARQISARGGKSSCRLAGDRVHIAGHTVLVLEGRLHLPGGAS